MTQVLTVRQPCRLDLDCPDGVQAPAPAAHELLKYLFSVRGKSVLDLRCGCGLFAIAAAKLGAGEVWAVDASRAAVDATRRNAEKNAVDVVAKLGDDFEPVADRTFDLIVAVSPARGFESILTEAPHHLDRGGELLTCVSSDADPERFESMLRERFRFRALPESPTARNYLAMKL
jgi:ribosomal protein L11 methylase PrmA